jgi:alcohol dehydrogenase class IV
MRFEFATAGRILFGDGVIEQLPSIARSFGSRALLVTGSSTHRAEEALALLSEAGITVSTFNVTGEPTIFLAEAGVSEARAQHAEMIIGLGGGSAIDLGKAIAALVNNEGDPRDYLEVVGKGQPLHHPALPYIAIPTTAGTGAEVTSNAVLASQQHRVKVSLRSPLMLPRYALIDPTLTHDLPPPITARTGMDALTQVLEPFVSNKANPLTDALCREGLARGARAIKRAYQDGNDVLARHDMALTSLFGGLALANAKLGAVHGFAGPIGGMFPAPHGAICARLLGPVMAHNIAALRARDPGCLALERYREIACIVTGYADANPEDGAAWASALAEALQIPRLSEFGITEQDFPEIVAKAAVASSMQGNPIKLTDQELMAILAEAL